MSLRTFGEQGEQVAPEKDEAALLLDFALQELTLNEELTIFIGNCAKCGFCFLGSEMA